MADAPTIERLLSALDPEQRQVAETLRGPVRVLAGAGIFLAGAAAMAGVLAVSYGGSPACWVWSLRLGFPGLLLGSAFAQLLIVVGALTGAARWAPAVRGSARRP